MPTRRQTIEAALVAERVALWADLNDALDVDEFSNHVSDLIRRIRVACEALGYGTPWLDVPLPALSWLELVESVSELGISARDVDWADARMTAETRNIDFHPCGDEHRDFHRWRPDG